MKIKSFGCWGDDVHSGLEQIKRIIRALEIKNCDIEMLDGEHCYINGSSGTHDVYLDKCDCADFAMKNKPCKHIYRLAIEKGYITDLPKRSKEAAAQFNPENEIKKYTDLYFSGAITSNTFIQVSTALSKEINKKPCKLKG